MSALAWYKLAQFVVEPKVGAMKSESPVSRRDHVDLAFDSVLFTMGLFALVTSAELGLTALLGDTALPGWLQFVSSMLVLATGVAGPVLAWLLHGRRLTVLAVLGAFVGGAAAGIVALSSQWLSIPLTWLVSPITTADSSGPIALLTVLGAVVIAGMVWLLVDAARDAVPSRRAHLLIDMLRVASVVAIVALRFVVEAVITNNTTGQISETLIFALVAGIVGGAIVVGADALTTLADRRRGERAAASSA